MKSDKKLILKNFLFSFKSSARVEVNRLLSIMLWYKLNLKFKEDWGLIFQIVLFYFKLPNCSKIIIKPVRPISDLRLAD